MAPFIVMNSFFTITLPLRIIIIICILLHLLILAVQKCMIPISCLIHAFNKIAFSIITHGTTSDIIGKILNFFFDKMYILRNITTILESNKPLIQTHMRNIICIHDVMVSICKT